LCVQILLPGIYRSITCCNMVIQKGRSPARFAAAHGQTIQTRQGAQSNVSDAAAGRQDC
jgi:hypothetical protein